MKSLIRPPMHSKLHAFLNLGRLISRLSYGSLKKPRLVDILPIKSVPVCWRQPPAWTQTPRSPVSQSQPAAAPASESRQFCRWWPRGWTVETQTI